MKISVRGIPAIAMFFSAIGIAIVGTTVFRIRPLFLAVAVVAVLLSAMLISSQPPTPKSHKGRSSVRSVAFAGLIFLTGAGYGLVQSITEGWQWLDLLILFPAAFGALLLWFAAKLRGREKASISKSG